MRTLILLVGIVSALGCNPRRSVSLATEDQKTLYALGMVLGRNVSPFNLSKDELAIVESGFEDAVTKSKPRVELEKYGPLIQQLAQSRGQAKAGEEKKRAQAYLDKAAAEPGVEKSPSGLLYKQLKPGTGDSPKASDTVKVHYHGTLVDGTVFDSSVQRGQPAEFPLSNVIPCWTEGVQKMKVGEKARLVCPSSIAYGDRGHPPTIPGGSTLIFEVELLEIKK
jgi:FKBP-type peptidyl-prolyl cis-trans isomerase FkpA